MNQKTTIKIKHNSTINLAYFYNPSKYIYFGLQGSLSSSSTIRTSDLNLIGAIVKKLKSLTNNTDNSEFEKFEVNEFEFISLGKYHGSIQINVKSGGDFSKNGIIGFMTEEQAKTLANKLEELL